MLCYRYWFKSFSRRIYARCPVQIDNVLQWLCRWPCGVVGNNLGNALGCALKRPFITVGKAGTSCPHQLELSLDWWEEIKRKIEVGGRREVVMEGIGGVKVILVMLEEKKCIHWSPGMTIRLLCLKVLTPYKRRGVIFLILWNSCGIPRIQKRQDIKLCIIISTKYLTPDTTGAVTYVLWFKEIET